MLDDILRGLDSLENGKEFAVPTPWKVIRPIVSAEEILKRALGHKTEPEAIRPGMPSEECDWIGKVTGKVIGNVVMRYYKNIHELDPLIPYELLEPKFKKINEQVMSQYKNLSDLKVVINTNTKCEALGVPILEYHSLSEKEYDIKVFRRFEGKVLGEPILEYHPFSVSLSSATGVTVHDLYTDEKFGANRNPYVGTLNGVTSIASNITGHPVASAIGILHDGGGFANNTRIIKNKRIIIRERVKKPGANADVLVYYPIWYVPIAVEHYYIQSRTLDFDIRWKHLHHEWENKIFSESSGALFYDSTYGRLFDTKLVDSYFNRKDRSSREARFVARLAERKEKLNTAERDRYYSNCSTDRFLAGAVCGILIAIGVGVITNYVGNYVGFPHPYLAGLISGVVGGTVIGCGQKHEPFNFDMDKLEIKDYFEGNV